MFDAVAAINHIYCRTVDTAFSIRGPLQGELIDFVRSSGFECPHTTDLVRDLTCLLASYREEDVPVFPDVFVALSTEVLTSISPGTQRIELGRTTLGNAAAKVLKDCATLAVRGWAVYVVKTGENAAEFGVFRSLMHSFATSSEETMIEIVESPPPVILIRNRGRFVVQLKNGKNDTFTASFTSAQPAQSAFVGHVNRFASEVVSAIPEEHKRRFHPYLVRLLIDTLQHSHGTLLAAHLIPEDRVAPETLSDGVWLSSPIDLCGVHRAAIEAKDAQALAALQSYEALLEGMVNSDGVVVFGTNGTILGYRVFLKPSEDEKSALPEKGGGRRRTYALMQRRLGDRLKAAFFRSQDGETECRTATI